MMPLPGKTQKVPPGLKHLGLRNISAFVEHRLHDPVRALTYALRASLKSVEIVVDRANREAALDIEMALEPVADRLERVWADATMTRSSATALASLPRVALLRVRLDALMPEGNLPPLLDLLILDVDLTNDSRDYHLLQQLLLLVRLLGCRQMRPRQIITCILATVDNVKIVRAAAGLSAIAGDEAGISVQTRLTLSGERFINLRQYLIRRQNTLCRRYGNYLSRVQ